MDGALCLCGLPARGICDIFRLCNSLGFRDGLRLAVRQGKRLVPAAVAGLACGGAPGSPGVVLQGKVQLHFGKGGKLRVDPFIIPANFAQFSRAQIVRDADGSIRRTLHTVDHFFQALNEFPVPYVLPSLPVIGDACYAGNAVRGQAVQEFIHLLHSARRGTAAGKLSQQAALQGGFHGAGRIPFRFPGTNAQKELVVLPVAVQQQHQRAGLIGKGVEDRGEIVGDEFFFLEYQLREAEEADRVQLCKEVLLRRFRKSAAELRDVFLHHFSVNDLQAAIQVILESEKIQLPGRGGIDGEGLCR